MVCLPCTYGTLRSLILFLLAIYLVAHCTIAQQRNEKKLLDDGKVSHMTPERVRLLTKIGFKWPEPRVQIWDKHFNELVEYKRTVRTAFIDSALFFDSTVIHHRGNILILILLHFVLLHYRRDIAISPPSRKRRNIRVRSCDAILHELLVDRCCRSFLRIRYFALFRIELGRWVTGQRNRKKKGKISREHEAKLNSIGFVWNLKDIM
jgi:hypothetical protein